MRSAIVLLGILMSDAVLKTCSLSYSNETKAMLMIGVAGLLVMDAIEFVVYVFGKKKGD